MGRPRINSSKSDSNNEYWKRFREKNEEILKTNRRQRKREARKYEKYECPVKYQKRLEKDPIRAWSYRKHNNAKEHNESSESTATVTPP